MDYDKIREILGPDYADLGDEQIEDLANYIAMVSRIAIRNRRREIALLSRKH